MKALPRNDRLFSTLFNPRYSTRKEAGRTGNEETRRKKRRKAKGRITPLPFPSFPSPLSRLLGYPWGLVWRRCSTFGTCLDDGGWNGGKEEGEWEGGRERMRGRMAKSQRQTATSFSLPMPPDKSECVYARSSVVVPVPLARTHARIHAHVFARVAVVATNTDGRSHSGDM